MSVLPSELRALLQRSRGRTVLIVGDLMLDHFVIGQVDRISPEAPVPVVLFDREEYRLGGAANVAHNVAALGGRVEIAGLVGADDSGTQLLEALSAAGIDTRSVVTPTSPERSKIASSGRFAMPPRGRTSCSFPIIRRAS